MIELIHLAFDFLILAALIYLIFFRSDRQEMSKHVPPKEDVEEITDLVEPVKPQRQFPLQPQLSLWAEEHQALVDYHSRYSAWLSAIMSWSGAGITKDNMFLLAEFRSRLEMLQQDFELVTGKMEQLVANAEVRSQHDKLLIDTLNLQNHANLMTFEMEKIFLETKQIELQTPINQQIERYEEMLKQILELNRAYLHDRLRKYQDLLPVLLKHNLAISKHIRALVDA